MKTIGDHSLFVINVLLIAGLVGVGFWLQQSGGANTSTSSLASSTQSASTASNAAVSETSAVATSTPIAGQNSSATTPAIRRSRENESGDGYIDE